MSATTRRARTAELAARVEEQRKVITGLAAENEAVNGEVERLRAVLHHIAYQKPVSDVSLDWHNEWQSLRDEARAALENKGG
jgi:regulator of replication initiation timing